MRSPPEPQRASRSGATPTVLKRPRRSGPVSRFSGATSSARLRGTEPASSTSPRIAKPSFGQRARVRATPSTKTSLPIAVVAEPMPRCTGSARVGALGKIHDPHGASCGRPSAGGRAAPRRRGARSRGDVSTTPPTRRGRAPGSARTRRPSSRASNSMVALSCHVPASSVIDGCGSRRSLESWPVSGE